MNRTEHDFRQLLSIQLTAIETLARHYGATNRHFALVRTAPDAVFADLIPSPEPARSPP